MGNHDDFCDACGGSCRNTNGGECNGSGIKIIEAERKRQIQREGYDSAHDDAHREGEMAMAAACYATPHAFRTFVGPAVDPWDWPWEADEWKPTPGNRIHELARAGALIAAEIDRLQRIPASSPHPPSHGVGNG